MVKAETGPYPLSRTHKRTFPEHQADNLFADVIAFTLANLPERRFLKKMAEMGNHLTFGIGPQEWELEVADDKRGPNDELIRVMTMTTIDPKTSQSSALGIITDYGIENVIGVYFNFRDSKSQGLFGIDPPLNFAEITKELREAERKRVLHSLRQTHSIKRTSMLQRLSQERVRADRRFLKRRKLFHL